MGKVLGKKSTPPSLPFIDPQQQRRRRQQCRNSDKLLVLLAATACILSITHICMHSHTLPSHHGKGNQHPHHKNFMKDALDNFVQKGNTNNKDSWVRKFAAKQQLAVADEAVKENENNKSTVKEFGKNGNISIEPDLHPVAHLNCADHGGPTDPHIIDEMVFWSDIPSDADYLSPMHPLNDPYTPDDTERFLTFEPDSAGWNNIRMAMETALVMSHAMGRTLVLPPEQKIWNLEEEDDSQKSVFGFNDFFHLDAISVEHKGFKVITMEEFLVREAMQGKMVEYGTNTTSYPPNKQTSWDGAHTKPLFDYLRKIGNTPHWEPYDCALAIPSSTEPDAVEELKTTLQSIMDGSYGKPKPTLQEFNSNPTPVDAPMAERMREMVADKQGEDDERLCLYDKPLQEAKLIHIKSDDETRLLTHFYAFIFFADWKQDLWSKRFVRDHLRYVDDIMCAAARIIEAVREHARKNKSYEANRDEGIYDALHVRRGDFEDQYPASFLPADELYEISKDALHQGSTIYIATDETDKSFFKPFKENYDLVFLDDFLDVIPTVNTNYYGMIDQLVAYKSRVFFGTMWSTLSGYVNRMRGYYITKNKLEGYKDGSMYSYYFMPEGRVNDMRQYMPVRNAIFIREFPISWRDIDKGIKEIANSIKEAIKK
mmetsp:Transcript_194/g.305  ORF Transcript_194/g.305 Transcript_194/m.305 type:complete len:655 (+) Transcript_194:140-2104(+)